MPGVLQNMRHCDLINYGLKDTIWMENLRGM